MGQSYIFYPAIKELTTIPNAQHQTNACLFSHIISYFTWNIIYCVF